MLIDRISDDLELRLLQLTDAGELFALTDANRIYLRRWLPWLDIIMQALLVMLNGFTIDL